MLFRSLLLAETDGDRVQPADGMSQLMVLLLGIEQAEMGALSLSASISASGLPLEASRAPTS